jgi:putative endonuclease
MKTKKTIWHIYILECADKTLYTGITNNLERRIKQHESGAGAKYMRGRAPFKLVYIKKFKTRSAASKREFEIKKMTRGKKLKLLKAYKA